MKRLKTCLVAGTAMFLSMVTVAHAQDTDSQAAQTPEDEAAAANQAEEAPAGDGEIIVTGSRTGPQRLQRTPIAISVLGSELLENQGLNTVQDIATYVPNLSFARNTLAAIISIRGIGSNNASAGSDPSVTMQVDGVYIARASGQLTDFFDVERIEVLRGPQGTLYGRNSVGGTINVISRVPSRDFTGRARLTYGNFNTIQGEAYISGPLADTAAVSLALSYRNHDAYFDNIAPGGEDVGTADRFGARGQFRLEIGAAIVATTRADYSTADEYYESYDHLLAPLPFSAPLANSLVGSFDEIAINGAQTLRSRVGGISEDISFELSPQLTLRSISAYRDMQSRVFNDNDASEVPVQLLRIEEEDRALSQEFTLTYVGDRLRAVAGVYYFGDTNNQTNFVQMPPSIRTPAPQAATIEASPEVRTSSFAVFGQAEFEIVPDLTIVAGGRYTTEKKEIDQFFERRSLNPATLGNLLPGSPIAFSIARNDDAFTPRLGLNFQATPDLFLYASATRGFKSGGFNNAAASAATAGFAPEEIWAYEAGVRSEWLDRRLRLNLTGFFYDYTNLQVRQLISAGNAVIGNAAAATVKGLELEFNAIPVDDFQISGSLSLLAAEYDSYPTASIPGGFAPYVPNQNCVGALCTINASGNRLDNAPSISGSVAIDYSPQIGPYEFNAHVDFSWRSRTFFDPSNIPLSSQEAYGLVNANIGYGPERNWRVEAFVRNLFDKGYYQTIAGNGLAPGAIVGDPRTFGVRVGYSW